VGLKVGKVEGGADVAAAVGGTVAEAVTVGL
jgi:hypothetical protein